MAIGLSIHFGVSFYEGILYLHRNFDSSEQVMAIPIRHRWSVLSIWLWTWGIRIALLGLLGGIHTFALRTALKAQRKHFTPLK